MIKFWLPPEISIEQANAVLALRDRQMLYDVQMLRPGHRKSGEYNVCAREYKDRGLVFMVDTVSELVMLGVPPTIRYYNSYNLKRRSFSQGMTNAINAAIHNRRKSHANII